jgi:hypothetical protein
MAYTKVFKVRPEIRAQLCRTFIASTQGGKSISLLSSPKLLVTDCLSG